MIAKKLGAFGLALLILSSTTLRPVASAAPKVVQPADLILEHGSVYLVEPARRWVQAVAVRDGKIVAVGSDAEIARYRGADTKLIDLKGRLAMPGLIDIHTHVAAAAAQIMTYSCNFSGYSSFEQVIERVRECAKTKSPGEWIVGQYWSSKLYGRLADASALKLLDDASGDHPVMLRNDTTHDRWVNSRALEIAGISQDTKDPVNGKIGHDPKTGALNGLLLESAGRLAEAHIPSLAERPTLASITKALAFGIHYLNSKGVTAFMDAAVVPNADLMRQATFSDARSDARGYNELSRDGALTAHTELCMLIDPDPNSPLGDPSKVFARRSELRTDLLRMDCAKIFLDGVQVSKTGYMVEPYVPDSVHGSAFRGEPKMSQERLNQLVVQLDAMNVSVKMHTAGDGAVRMALNAIAAARRINGDKGPIHSMAHAGYMTLDDQARAGRLRAAVDASPTVWYPGPILDGSVAAMGPRGYRFFPFKTYLAKGILVTGGTDWKTLPEEFSDLWDGMEGMVTRRNPLGHAPGALLPEEAIDVPTMVKIYTLNSARLMGLQDRTGSLVPGKDADIIVLDQNIFKVDPDKISDTQVDLTLLKGKVVYQRNGQ